MSDYLALVEDAVRALEVHSPTTFSWFGSVSPQLTPTVRRALTPKTARSYLLYNMELQLYSDFYCKGMAMPPRTDAAGPPMLGMTAFVEQLSEANCGKGYWQAGWEMLTTEDGVLMARREDLQLRVREGDYLPGDGPSVPGATVSLRFPKEFVGISPGFYMALSDSELGPEDFRDLVRFYWNLNAEGATCLMRLVTSALNVESLPFRLKVVNERGRYDRCDAAVLYVRKSHYASIASVLEALYPQVLPDMRSGTPVFTKRLAHGLGFAEDPGSEDSFGQHRCHLIAEGILGAHEAGKRQFHERMQVVVDRFNEEGIKLERPYLNRRSADNYTFEPRLHAELVAPVVSSGRPVEIEGEAAFLETAIGISQFVVQEAIWYDGQCNWIGAEVEQDGRSGFITLAYKALAPSLYSGTAGIALFLAQLHAITGDGELRRAALGAIRQTLAHADVIESITRLGLYTGWSGIVLAAERVARLLGAEELISEAQCLLKRCMADESEHDFDLIFGRAGAIVVALALRDTLALGDPSLTDFATRLADELLQTADKSAEGYSWRSSTFKHPRNLTGFSHGAAGVGYALLELYQATGFDRYRHAAEMAFSYERAHFDPVEGNWPDFREESGSGRGSRSKAPHRFAVAWCHGAPGIALSRLRAYQILGDPTYKAEAIIALQTTRKMVEAALNSGLENYSLCHGLAGNAEILLHGRQVLGHEWLEGAQAETLALEVANKGIERYAADPASWPCGAGGGQSPSLMLGLAGIGHFYLRLHEPSISSVLLV